MTSIMILQISVWDSEKEAALIKKIASDPRVLAVQRMDED